MPDQLSEGESSLVLNGAGIRSKNEGDVFEFIYNPAKGLTVNKNNEEKTNITSLIIKQALFGIWLSDQPVQEKLKDALSGK